MVLVSLMRHPEVLSTNQNHPAISPHFPSKFGMGGGQPWLAGSKMVWNLLFCWILNNFESEGCIGFSD